MWSVVQSAGSRSALWPPWVFVPHSGPHRNPPRDSHGEMVESDLLSAGSLAAVCKQAEEAQGQEWTP